MTCHVLSCVCSRSRSHTRRASLCDLALYPRFHAAALALSKHRETREGESDYYAGVMWHLVILKLPVKHPYVLPGVLPVNGADIYHPHHCNHQSSYPWTPNVWMNTLQFANPQWFWFVFVGVLYFNEYPLECVPDDWIWISFSSLPTENSWAFAKWNAIQAVGIMSFGEFVCMMLMLMMECV